MKRRQTQTRPASPAQLESRNMNQEEIDKLTADVKQIHKDAEHITNPLDLFDPAKEVRIISKGTKEWDARQERDAQWLKDNPRPPVPTPPYHVLPDGTWEQRFATEEQLAAKRAQSGEPPIIKHRFTAVVDPQRPKWAVMQGNLTQFFSSADDVAIFCRKLSRGEHGEIEFYRARGPVEEWLGEELGDYITTESW
jgi:hypothetical protein